MLGLALGSHRWLWEANYNKSKWNICPILTSLPPSLKGRGWVNPSHRAISASWWRILKTRPKCLLKLRLSIWGKMAENSSEWMMLSWLCKNSDMEICFLLLLCPWTGRRRKGSLRWRILMIFRGRVWSTKSRRWTSRGNIFTGKGSWTKILIKYSNSKVIKSIVFPWKGAIVRDNSTSLCLRKMPFSQWRRKVRSTSSNINWVRTKWEKCLLWEETSKRFFPSWYLWQEGTQTRQVLFCFETFSITIKSNIQSSYWSFIISLRCFWCIGDFGRIKLDKSLQNWFKDTEKSSQICWELWRGWE